MQRNELLTQADLVALENTLKAFIQECFQANPSLQRRYYRSAEVCEWLNVSPSTLQNMRTSGMLPYTRIGTTLFYPIAEIERLLEDNLIKFPT